MPQRRLPDDETLAVLLQTRSRKDIAAEYGVQPQAVSNRIARQKIPTPRRAALPWDLKPEHADHTYAQYLRALRRHHRGTAREGDRTVRYARRWAAYLAAHRQAVTYDPAFDGFRLVPVAAVPHLTTTCIQPQP